MQFIPDELDLHMLLLLQKLPKNMDGRCITSIQVDFWRFADLPKKKNCIETNEKICCVAWFAKQPVCIIFSDKFSLLTARSLYLLFSTCPERAYSDIEDHLYHKRS